MLRGSRLLHVSGSGLAFPSASNTGCRLSAGSLTTVVNGSTGTGWSATSTTMTITTGANGTTISGLLIPMTVTINSGVTDLTIRDCVVATGGAGATTGIGLHGTTRLVITDCTINGLNTTTGRCSTAIAAFGNPPSDNGTVLRRCNIYYSRAAISIEQGLIQDCYVHDPGAQSGDHVDGVISSGLTGLLSPQLDVIHNTLLCNLGQTSGFICGCTFGPQTNRLFQGNLIAGGSFGLYGGNFNGGNRTDTGLGSANNSTAVGDTTAHAGDLGAVITCTTAGVIPAGTTITAVTGLVGTIGTGYVLSNATTGGSLTGLTFVIGPSTANFVITGNRFSRMYFNRCGQFGTHTDFDVNGAGNIWSANAYHDSNAPILVTDP